MRNEQRQVYCGVLVNNSWAPEYQTEQSGNTVTCWIPAEENKEYTIMVYNDAYAGNRNYDQLSACTLIDGKLMVSGFLDFRSWTRSSGAYTSAGLQPFVFGKFVTKDEGPRHQMEKLSKLGTIEVQIWKTMQTGVAPSRPVTNEAETYNEKEIKKGKLMCDRVTSLGSRSLGAPTGLTTLVAHLTNEPFCTFIFRYRSKELLEAEDIIPNPAPASNRQPQNPSAEILALSQHLPANKRAAVLAALNGTDGQPAAKRQKQEPRFNHQKGDKIEIDLEADGGPVERRIPVMKKNTVEVDLSSRGATPAPGPRVFAQPKRRPVVTPAQPAPGPRVAAQPNRRPPVSPAAPAFGRAAAASFERSNLWQENANLTNEEMEEIEFDFF
ncbi:hypothetical protein HK097_008198 [Rhizophlyctis rosea]|uniref:DUF7918 domain-containing protein n=1 Tax=Rhizophlyctis rosea TaxID=64517 RepID=A0AAD5SID1_9FUNG|nr:hypothetical protein HK097_008198 [Rhizophlyctis rosea]